jgi:hypothetical protein
MYGGALLARTYSLIEIVDVWTPSSPEGYGEVVKQTKRESIHAKLYSSGD